MQQARQWLFVVSMLCFAAVVQAALPLSDGDGNKLPSLSPMLKQVNPAVVNIATFSKQQVQNSLSNDPLFRRFFNVPDQQRIPRHAPKRRQQSAGSGVIVDAQNGIVMTNSHVIDGADEVQISLADGRTFTAEVKGSDPELDIAILQIDAEDLSQVPLGDARVLEVGDFVVAIGSPFGLGQTVTTGIVSALERTGLGIEGYENFIQTDASINPGNSGGALVNLHGELIGINTAILAPAGGNVGIGFAIPINMAKASMEQIIAHGEVRRGQLGIGIQDISPELSKAFNLKNGQQGVLITGVGEDSSAEKAGLKAGDIIVAVDESTTSSTGQLRSQIGIKEIGDKVKLTLIREGKTKKVGVTVGEPQKLASVSDKLHSLLEGAQCENNPDGEGVLVAALSPNSVAAYGGLRPGDIIVGANRQWVNNIKSFQEALSYNKQSVLLQVNRNGRVLYLVIQ
ncbi:MAG: Do/DeqQ family serine protease [Porticoccus sp.]|jgi:Do/DeqQ family serine protease